MNASKVAALLLKAGEELIHINAVIIIKNRILDPFP